MRLQRLKNPRCSLGRLPKCSSQWVRLRLLSVPLNSGNQMLHAAR
jgi:hypothetical protein